MIVSKQKATLDELQAKISPEGNYKLYRQLEFENRPPMIPFFGSSPRSAT